MKRKYRYSLRHADADTKAALIAIAIAIVVYGGVVLAVIVHAGDL